MTTIADYGLMRRSGVGTTVLRQLARGENGEVARIVIQAFEENVGSYTRTAARLGMTRRHLYTVVRKLAIVGELERIREAHKWRRVMWDNTSDRCLYTPLMAARARGDNATVRQLVVDALRQSGGHYSGAAEALGVHYMSVNNYVRSLHLLGFARRLRVKFDREASEARKQRKRENLMAMRNICNLTILKAEGRVDELRAKLVEAIQASEGNLSAAGRALGVSLNTVHRYVRELDLYRVVDAARGDGGALRTIGREAVSRRG